MNDESIMAFGKHKGEKLGEIPRGYFIYIYDRGWAKGDLKKYIENSVPMLKTKYISKLKLKK